MPYLEPPLGWRRTAPTGDELVRLAREQALKQTAGLVGTVNRAILYVATVENTDEILVRDQNGARWVDAYTRYELLPDVRAGREEVWHRGLTGAVLRDVLPVGAGIVLDRGQQHEIVIHHPAAIPVNTPAADGAAPGTGSSR